MLLKDGHPDRAATALEQADTTAEGFDFIRYHTLRGVIALRQQAFEEALNALDAAVAAGSQDQSLHLVRARAAYAIDRCPVTLEAITRAGPLADADGDTWVMRAECHWRAEAHALSLAALEGAMARFPERRADLARTRIWRLLELGLYQAAVEAGRAFLAEGGDRLEDHLFFAEALLQSGQAAEARDALEAARLRFGEDERVLVQLGHAWLGTEHRLIAARMFERASAQDPIYARDAAELYREKGFTAWALRRNGALLDQKAKLRQRLAILLDMERFEGVVALGPRLSRLGLLKADEELRYALAYARFRLGDYRQAEQHLRRLTSPALFQRATALRQAIARCRASEAQCL